MKALEGKNLVVGYGAGPAIDGVSLTAAQGELVGILGPNGAGKSTLLKSLVGLLEPRQGSIELMGEDVTRYPVEHRVREGLCLVPEGRRLFGGLTVVENLRAGQFSGRSGFSTADVLDLFPRLADRRSSRAATLSGGEQQMLAIGRALCGGPRVLLVDEPSLGLAPKIVESVFATFRELTTEGLTIVLSEQNVDAAVRVTDRCLLLNEGRVFVDQPTNTQRERDEFIDAYGEVMEIGN